MYQHVINAIYRFHDLMLARWLDLVEEDTYIMVLSDHGFHSDYMRVKVLPKEPAAIAREHNYLGMMTLCGPGIKKDDRVYGASLLDICPTILALYDLAIGKDMDGKVLSSIFETPKDFELIQTWDHDRKPSSLPLNLTESKELIQQLVDLGYVENTNFDSPAEVKKLMDENNYYLARSYFEASKFREAGLILANLSADYPENHRYLQFLAEIAAEMKDTQKLEDAIAKLEGLEMKSSFATVLLKGKLAFLKNDFQSALALYLGLSKSGENKSAYLEYQIANALLKMHDYEKSIQHFKNNIVLNPNSAHGLHGLGVAYLGLKDSEKAIDCLIDSISMTYFNPSAHFHLGLAFKSIKAYEEAEQAFLVAKQLAPRMSKVNLELIELYEKYLDREESLEALKEDVKVKSKGTVYIVSGLPRSGTSMMMQILEAGGLEIFSDSKRGADTDNPKGYYEHEAIKRLASDNTIIAESKGKVVKVISNLLKFLPANYTYKVILMRRDIQEVMRSQEKMLQNRNVLKENTAIFELDAKLIQSYEDAKEVMARNPNFEYIELDYKDVVKEPELAIQAISKFLELNLSLLDMKNKVDKSLYRNK